MSGGLRRLVGGGYIDRLRSVAPRWVVEVVVTFTCVGLAALSRLVLDMISPGALAFGLVYPIALLATLIAGWRSGVLSLLIAGLGSWYFVMPPRMGFKLLNFQAGVDVVAFFVTGGCVVLLAAVVMSELQARIADQAVMRHEVDHRVKNNFQMILGVLEMQAARAADPELRAALADTAAPQSG